MTELFHVALRALGVVLPGAGVLGWSELNGGAPAGDFGTFLGTMGLSLLTAAVWAAVDAGRGSPIRPLIRWVATAVVVGVGLGLATTLTEPGTPPGPERRAEAASMSVFYGIPLLASATLGAAVGAAGRRHEDTVGTGAAR